MNFEVVDNVFQVTLLGSMAILSLIVALRRRSRIFLLLCGGYGCMSLGTLYYVLCLMITGKVPQVFYVAEISWIAAYLFYLSVSLFQKDIQMKGCNIAVVCALVYTVISVAFKIMGPSPVTTIAFAVTVGTIAYRSAWGLCQNSSGKLLDVLFLLMITFQLGVYIVSVFIKDYTRFNLYFLVDILLTLTMIALFPALKKEVINS